MADEPTGNATAGKKAFTRHCQQCHNVAAKGKHGVGPTLGTVWGRKAGSVKGFKFSSAFNAVKGKVWNAELIDKWITNPAAMAPGTTMAFAGVRSEQERKDIIRYIYESHPKNKKK